MGEQFRLRALFGCSGGIFTKEVGPAGGFFLFCFGVCVCVCVRACVFVCVREGCGVFCFLFRIWAPHSRSLFTNEEQNGWDCDIFGNLASRDVTFCPCS